MLKINKWKKIPLNSKIFSIITVAFCLVNTCDIKGQTTIWEEIEIYSQEKVYTIERLLVDKNIGLVNACNIK